MFAQRAVAFNPTQYSDVEFGWRDKGLSTWHFRVRVVAAFSTAFIDDNFMIYVTESECSQAA